MVTFVTLFLGLVTSVHPVEVAVSGPVAAVEIHLDGHRVGVLHDPPWRLECDLGDGLTPHELVAVALGADGEELSRTRQWVNLPRSRAEVGLVLEQGEPGGPSKVRLVWQSLEQRRLESARVRFDGKLLPVVGDSRFLLPDFDPRRPHILTAEVELEGGLTATAERALGGIFGSEVTTEMTAVPLARKRGGVPRLAQLASALEAAGTPLQVAAVDRGESKLVVVIDPPALPELGAIGIVLDRLRTGDLGENTRLEVGEELRLVSTLPARVADRAVPYDLFPISQAFTAADGPIDFLLTHVGLASGEGEARISDAVAAAAVQAATGNRPRAVVLILGDTWDDASRFSPAQVQEYLGELRVPLRVWTVRKGGARRVSEDRIPMSAPTPWGSSQDVSSNTRLGRAIADLRRLLDSQVIAWVEGSHLPQEIRLTGAAPGMEMAR